MCGIAGYVGQQALDERRLDRTLELMQRRGPDHQAHRHFFHPPSGRHVHLLSARLRILDLDARANQPFPVGSKWMVYNGETYNYLELREELQRSGRTFTTTSDTEVLLQALDRDGPAALERAEGMWALAVFDQADGSLFLARDRFGEKPLYLFAEGDSLYFGSEVKLIAALLGRRLEVDVDHLRRYLVNGYKALYKRHRQNGAAGEPRAFFRGLRELPLASTLRLPVSGREELTRYWQPSFAADDTMTYAEAVAGTRDRLIRSVELRLRADVPLAFCMSGGVDSNALIAIARRELEYDVHGFTIASSDARYEESDMVATAVRDLGIRHTSIPTDTRDFLPRLRELVRYHDAPVYTITYYAHWLLMQSVAEHGYRVAVSGTGADELLSGYYDHFLLHLHEVRARPELHAAALRGWRERVQPLVRNPFLADADLFVRDPAFRGHIYLDAERFSSHLLQPFDEPFAEERYSPSQLRNRMLNELFHEAVPVILHEDDLNAMYYSIENRSPFLDRHLFEFTCRIPPRHLVRDGYAKVVLRDAMRGIVADPILDSHRKVGFNASIGEFLDVRDPAVRGEVLAPSPIFEHVRRERIAALLDRQDLPNSESKFLFYFLCAKMFLEEFAA